MNWAPTCVLLVASALPNHACSVSPLEDQSPSTSAEQDETDTSGTEVGDETGDAGQEETATNKRCGPGQGQSQVFESGAQLGALAGCQHFEGDLECYATGLDIDEQQLNEALSELELIDGSLRLKHFELVEQLKLPKLRQVRGELSLSGFPKLHTIDAPLLEEVDGELSLAFCAELSKLPLPRLDFAQGLSFSSLSGLRSLELPSLRSVGDRLNLSRTPALDRMQAPRLADVERLHLESTNLAELEQALPALEEVRDWVIIRANYAFDDAHAHRFVEGIAHVGGEVTIYANPAQDDGLGGQRQNPGPAGAHFIR